MAYIKQTKKEPRQYRNITIDADLQPTLNELKRRLSAELGIPLTRSQTLRLTYERIADDMENFAKEVK